MGGLSKNGGSVWVKLRDYVHDSLGLFPDYPTYSKVGVPLGLDNPQIWLVTPTFLSTD